MKLTIGITTYNRSAYVGETIKCLLAETKKLRSSGEVEIIVADNGSTDNTLDIINGFTAEVGFLALESDQNVGVYNNINKIIELCRGEYFWCFGDDDIVQNGYIERICELLSANEYKLLVTERVDFYKEDEIDYEIPFLSNVFVDKNGVLSEFSRYDRMFGFLTSVIYKTEIISELFERERGLLFNNYINKYVCWYVANLYGVCFVEGPTVYKRCSIGNGSYFQESLRIRLETFLFDPAEIGVRLSSIDKVIADLFLKRNVLSLRELLKFNRDGASLKCVYMNLKERALPFRYFVFVFMIIAIPARMVRIVEYVYFRLK